MAEQSLTDKERKEKHYAEMVYREALEEFVDTAINNKSSIPVTEYGNGRIADGTSKEVQVQFCNKTVLLHVYLEVPNKHKGEDISGGLLRAIEGFEKEALGAYKRGPSIEPSGNRKFSRFPTKVSAMKVTLQYDKKERLLTQVKSGDTKEDREFNQNFYRHLAAYDIQELINISYRRDCKVENMSNPYAFDMASKLEEAISANLRTASKFVAGKVEKLKTDKIRNQNPKI